VRSEAPIFRFNEERPEIVRATIERVVAEQRDPLHALNDAAYHEARRLDGSRRPADQARLEAWRTLARQLGRLGDDERRARLHGLVTEYVEDIAGRFNPTVYRVSRRVLPPLVTSLLAPSTLPRLVAEWQALSLRALRDKVLVEGDLETPRALAERGTLVFVPTHLSNMDSIVFGYALERARLPPATYGAGKNLFTNPVLSFFMHNLGAYKVDRRLRHALYKDCLKAYSTVLLERGFHSLFFPGGTRSRSGAVERHLKLGLLGTAVEAYVRTVLAGRERKIFIVPATINYLITLEAETLIADFLSEAGKARYIIEDDESSRWSRVVAFARKLLGMDGAVVIRFGAPLDPFGNTVDAEGVSHDRRGRRVETASYVRDVAGDVRLDAERDAQYTRELGREICVAFRRETAVMATHVVATAAFELLRRAAATADLFQVLRAREVVVPRDALALEVVRVRDELVGLGDAGEVHLAPPLVASSGGDIVAEAMRAFRGYHSSPVIEARADGVALRDPNLLFYYQNRLVAHGLGWDPAPPAGRAPHAA
jgi:glycerol-3-phosphate O-acyltransferase